MQLRRLIYLVMKELKPSPEEVPLAPSRAYCHRQTRVCTHASASRAPPLLHDQPERAPRARAAVRTALRPGLTPSFPLPSR